MTGFASISMPILPQGTVVTPIATIRGSHPP